jgi:hypothetical protein
MSKTMPRIMGSAKPMFRGQFIILNTYIYKESSKIPA